MRRSPVIMSIVAVALAIAASSAWAGERVSMEQAAQGLKNQCPQARFYEHEGRVTRVYGQPFAYGETPEASAEQFRVEHAAVFGAEAADLVLEGLPGAISHVQPVMYERDIGDYKFYLVRYAQQREGIPVFRADLRLLVRNESGFPLVLAAANLRDLGDFVPPADATAREPGEIGHTQAIEAAATKEVTDYAGEPIEIPGPGQFEPSEYVIWAGAGNESVAPRLAVKFLGENANGVHWLFVSDASTGEIFHAEPLVFFAELTGNVSGMATVGPKADFCSPEVLTPMPYAQVSTSYGDIVYADANGDYVIPNTPTGMVTVESSMAGLYFVVDNLMGEEDTLSQKIRPPGPADFAHNAFNSDEYVRAEVNAYVQANVVRDFCLTYNPDYPTIAGQMEFLISVNGDCLGAYYQPQIPQLKFCASRDGHPNTAYTPIIHHEYGHHIIYCGGNTVPCQYHEGMADSFAVLIADEAGVGYGYEGDCDSEYRTADNDMQYPCVDDNHHYCGQLLSGCVWSTRNELAVTHPEDYSDILSNLTVNSILLHTGYYITPEITVDFLVLDDDDGYLGNGTPHSDEICAGFGTHCMDCPPWEAGLSVSPMSEFLSEGPDGGPFTPESFDYTLENAGDYTIDYVVAKSADWLTVTNAIGTIPACGSTVVTAWINTDGNNLAAGVYRDTLHFVNTTDHVGDAARDVTLHVGLPIVAHEWTLDSDPGWSTEGLWEFGQPTGVCRDPNSGHTGSNVYGYNLDGCYEDDQPEFCLTSTAIDCTGLWDVELKFWRWLDTYYDDWVELRVSNDGRTWQTIWSNDGWMVDDYLWLLQEYDISAVADDEATVYLRWTMGPTFPDYRMFCGWNIDDIQIVGVVGPSRDCNGNGVPDSHDLLDCDGSVWCSDCNGNGVIDVCDLGDGTSEDGNANGIPDECEDCNNNGTLDEWDIANGTSADCNANGIPDECDLADATSNDCNANGVPDECDLASGTSTDCDLNGLPDECQTNQADCNDNGIFDACDIFIGTSADCDFDGVPDECQNGPDCNNNGVFDWCDIASGSSEDANGDGIPDECGMFVVQEWTLDTDPGWYCPPGWEFGQPAGLGGEFGGPDPTSGRTGDNVYGFDLSGDYPPNMQAVWLTSSVIDCTGLSNVRLSFWRWLGVDGPKHDRADLRAFDGNHVVIIWENETRITDASWQYQEIDISAVADDNPTLLLFWGMGPTNSTRNYCGWNIDDIRITASAE